jgi:hypothetical protein
VPPSSATVATAPTRSQRVLGWLADSEFGAVAAAAALAMAVVLLFTHPESRIHEITLTNPTDYEVFVSVGTEPAGATLPLVALRPHETRVIKDVLDQGDQWVLHLRGQGREVGSITLPRADLLAQEWQVELPNSLGDALRAQGAPTSPR